MRDLSIHCSASRYPNACEGLRVPEELYRDVGRAVEVAGAVERILELCRRALGDDPRFGFDERGPASTRSLLDTLKW